jgi:hypothetical protein
MSDVAILCQHVICFPLSIARWSSLEGAEMSAAIAQPLPVPSGRVNVHPVSPGQALAAIPLGLVFGFTLGAVARAWMRLVSPDREFSWAGTPEGPGRDDKLGK